ncbi:MAG: AtpZ/AtpI family protein [Clostridia bacterium]|nr:AtpZ/AtpI family protein [Clostridia bacterium]
MAISFGITMIVAIFLGFYGGNWLDRRFGTAPWLMLFGIMAGVAVGFSSIWSELSALEKDFKAAGSGKNKRKTIINNEDKDNNQ